MCDAYAAENSQVTALHKKNGGLSDARNFGVAHARGEYIVFVDSDDYVSDDYVEYLYELKTKYNADIAFTGVIKGTDDNHIFNPECREEKRYSEEQAMIRMMYGRRCGVSAYAKIYPIELVKKHLFPKGRLFEDLAVMYRIFGDCRFIAYGDKDIYLYRQREGAITHQAITKKHLYGVKAAQEEIDYCVAHYPDAVPAAIFRYCFKIMQYIPGLLEGAPEDRKTFRYLQIKMKKYAKELLSDPHVTPGAKVKCAAILAGFEPTKRVWQLWQRVR